MDMGSKDIWSLGYKKAWAFVGVKGLKIGVDKADTTA
jgi:hypothetical protein